MITKPQILFSALSFAAALWGSANVHAQTAPILAVNAAAKQHAIDPNIYGIASYGLDATFAKEIQVPNVRWGGDGTSRYNWEVDSSNSGFDWYFMGGSGVSNPVPGASVDFMVNTYKPANAGALITIPIIPYVNNSSAWNVQLSDFDLRRAAVDQSVCAPQRRRLREQHLHRAARN